MNSRSPTRAALARIESCAASSVPRAGGAGQSKWCTAHHLDAGIFAAAEVFVTQCSGGIEPTPIMWDGINCSISAIYGRAIMTAFSGTATHENSQPGDCTDIFGGVCLGFMGAIKAAFRQEPARTNSVGCARSARYRTNSSHCKSYTNPEDRCRARGEAKERERAAKAEQRKEKSDADLVRYTAELASFTKWLFAATVVLFLATLGLVCAAIVQSRDMKASLEVNRTAAIAALRQANAIVAMESPIPGIVELKLVEYADEGSDVALTDPVHSGVPPPFCRPLVNLQNRGRTELTVHRFCCDWIVSPAVEEVTYYHHVESWNGALPKESSVWVKSQNGIRLYQAEAHTIGDFGAFLWV
jgi:hypothetical protein